MFKVKLFLEFLTFLVICPKKKLSIYPQFFIAHVVAKIDEKKKQNNLPGLSLFSTLTAFQVLVSHFYPSCVCICVSDDTT